MNVGRWMWTFFPVSRVMTSAPRSSLWPRISRKAISHAYRWIGGCGCGWPVGYQSSAKSAASLPSSRFVVFYRGESIACRLEYKISLATAVLRRYKDTRFSGNVISYRYIDPHDHYITIAITELRQIWMRLFCRSKRSTRKRQQSLGWGENGQPGECQKDMAPASKMSPSSQLRFLGIPISMGTLVRSYGRSLFQLHVVQTKNNYSTVTLSIETQGICYRAIGRAQCYCPNSRIIASEGRTHFNAQELPIQVTEWAYHRRNDLHTYDPTDNLHDECAHMTLTA